MQISVIRYVRRGPFSQKSARETTAAGETGVLGKGSFANSV